MMYRCPITIMSAIPYFGYKAHMGAGSITSNVKSDRSLVTVRFNGEKLETGLKNSALMWGLCRDRL